jgi:hypothetical protein
MALVESTVKATIKAQLDAAYGAPADPATQAKLVEALSKAIIEILQNQLTVTVTIPGGSSAGVYVGINS